MSQQETKKLHIVVLPWLAFGHMIPFLELSKSLASKGHHISYISTPRNIQRLQPKIPPHLSPLITLVSIPLPLNETLPPGAEATSDVGSVLGGDILKAAFDGLEQPISRYLESIAASHPIDWIIHDFVCYWIQPIADRLCCRKVFFSIYFSRTLSIMAPSADWSDPTFLTEPIPWIPFHNTVYFLPHEVKKLLSSTTENSSGVTDMFRFTACLDGCDVIAVRSCMELEGQYIELIGELHKKVVIPVGLMPVSLKQDQGDETWQSISEWLEKQKQGSVVYVSQGSEFELSQDELTELALGLEQSNLPFIWALRQVATDGPTVLELPSGFEERTQERGVVWTKWAPQERILAHESVGGLLTHCGWSSIIEALQFGKPLIMLPLAIDHGLYARFMVELKVGIEIPRDEEDGSFTRSSVAETLKLVLQDGQVYKDEAKKLSEIVADLSLQEHYIHKFVGYLQLPL